MVGAGAIFLSLVAMLIKNHLIKGTSVTAGDIYLAALISVCSWIGLIAIALESLSEALDKFEVLKHRDNEQ